MILYTTKQSGFEIAKHDFDMVTGIAPKSAFQAIMEGGHGIISFIVLKSFDLMSIVARGSSRWKVQVTEFLSHHDFGIKFALLYDQVNKSHKSLSFFHLFHSLHHQAVGDVNLPAFQRTITRCAAAPTQFRQWSTFRGFKKFISFLNLL